MYDSFLHQNQSLLSSFHSDEQFLIKEHLNLVLSANKKHNLTRITSLEDAQLLHIEDSLSAYPEMLNAPKGCYADLGTGGGYPGIPLAIVTHRQTILVDSIKKKAAVLSQIVEDLKLDKNISIFSGRIEELAQDIPNSFMVLTARALSSLPSLLELAAPLLNLNGHLICYKAILEEEELKSAIALENKLGMRATSDRKILLSDLTTQRRILVFEKFKDPEVSLPRQIGIAQKRPYS